MASTSIEDLFDNDRFPGGLALLTVLLYFPIGVILAVFRLFIGLQTFLIACVLPKASSVRSSVMRVLCGILGIIVTKEGIEHRDKNVKVLVANYTTTLDHLAVDLAIPCYLPCVWDLPPALMWLLGYTDLGAKQGRDTLIQNAKSRTSASDVPILTFPEGASTNGKVGLLKFSVWPFSLDQAVQPLIIKVTRPSFTLVAPSILGGRWWIDVLWFLFVPYTVFHIRILPSKSNQEASASEFSRTVQEYIASEMCVQATVHTSADKVEYAKRKLHVPPAPASSPSQPLRGSSSPNSQIDEMARQVKDVLPHVPVDAIRGDLALTKDVDLTITNLLEGRVTYTQREAPSRSTPSSPASSSTASSSPASSPTNTQPKSGMSFWKDAKNRQMSLEERKQQLLATARQRYMAKHGML